MKSKRLSVVLVAAGLMMVACNNSQKTDGNAVESDSKMKVATTRVAQTDDQTDDEDDFVAPERTIASIQKEWEGKTLKVDTDNKLPAIKQFALAFCKAYPQCKTNEAMLKYLNDPKAVVKDEYSITINNPDDNYDDEFLIYCNSRNGFIRSMEEIQTDRFTYLCYWNRKDNHKLVAAYMEECWESADWDQCLALFYDYDPATGIMTPEPALTEMIEKRMEGYNAYWVTLPEEGKDITVSGLYVNDDEDFDDDECEPFVLKWNGTTFEWEE